jgi:SAM-dependent methyltransferase
MINIRAKIEKSIRQRGLRETVRLSLYNLAYYAGKLAPAALLAAYRERDFDRKFGVDTAGRIDLSDLGDVDGIAADLGTRYEAIAPESFHEVMSRLSGAGIDLSQLTFIDYGCGKGRALLLATHYPFRSIIGIEISQRLVDVAVQNVSIYPKHTSQSVLVEQADALVWEPPNEPTLFYFYHPFEAELLARVLDRIRQSIEARPRKAYLVYVGAMEDVLAEAAFLRPVAIETAHPRHGIYECRAGID